MAIGGENKNSYVYTCFTKEQQEAYEKLSDKQRAFVDYRAKGYNKKEASTLAGYGCKNHALNGHLLERNYPVIAELIRVLQAQAQARSITEEESLLNQQIDVLANQQSVEKMFEVIEGADSETAKRIQFYRDIMNGKIKSVKTTVKRNGEGKVIERTTVETSDVDMKMKARHELDKLLGLTMLPNLDDKFKVGDITINIVDASKKEELEDSRNIVDISQDGTVLEEPKKGKK
jgi:phage terminase small subunit